MENPGFQIKLMPLFGASFLALAATLYAEAPEKNSRAKPQVVYHVRPASNSAATLHSQEKNQNHEPPPVASGPTSVERPREPASTAPEVPQQRVRPQTVQKQGQSNRPKFQKKQMARPSKSVKSKGHGKGKH